MSKYQQEVEKFFGKYEKPVVEPITVGFSGIDPQRKCFGSIGSGTDDHEKLTSLQGGDENGHYHLTQEQLEWIADQMSGKYKPDLFGDQEIHIYPDEPMEEYEPEGDNVRPGG